MTLRTATPQAAQVHAMWNSVAAGWSEHADFVDARGGQLTARLLALVAPRPGERLLDLAGGPGGVGLAAARAVPGAHVVVSDVAPAMVDAARARAAARGLTNVSARVLDLERIDEPDASVDAVVCRDGLQFALDPVAAAREIRRVLRPGGRVAVATWGPRAENPWLGIVLDAVAAQLGRPVPPPGVPGPFSLDDEGRLAEILRTAGLSEVGVTRVAVPLRTGSVEEWWQRTTALAGPLAQVLAGAPDPVRAGVRDRAVEAARAYETADGIELPGLGLVASARRP